MHKNFGPLFNPAIADDAKNVFRDRIMGKFMYIELATGQRDYLMGKQFTVADGYLFTMLRWADSAQIRSVGAKESDGLQGARRRTPEGAGGLGQGRLAEGGIRPSPPNFDEKQNGPDRSGPFVRPSPVPRNGGVTILYSQAAACFFGGKRP